MPEYQGRFEEFGDFETTLEFKGALSFINRFKEQVESTHSLMLKSEANLDYSISIPLYLLSQEYKNFSLVPINFSLLDYQQHLDIGLELKEAINHENKRVAVIASAELSHRLSPKGSSGFSPQAKEFDKKVIQLLKKKNNENLISIDRKLNDAAQACGLRAILILQGIVQDMNYDFQVLNYEAPFGIGYLTAEYKFA
jgi:AmmeMemoRadiSam system protein B